MFNIENMNTLSKENIDLIKQFYLILLKLDTAFSLLNAILYYAFDLN